MPSISPPNVARELWMEIFRYSVESESDVFGSSLIVDSSTHVTADALRLSHVCRLWRKIITSLPELWSSLDIYSFPPHILPIVNLYLQHSAGRGLDLCIDIDLENRLLSNNSGFVEVVSLLMQHKARFRKLSLGEVEDFPCGAYPPEGPIFPLLESVTLYYQQLSPPCWLWEGIRTAPKLDNINLCSSFLATDDVRDMLAGSQVRMFRIVDIGIFEGGFYDFREFLSTLHRIQTIIIEYDTSYSLEAPLSPPLKNQSLRTLVIENVDDPHNLISSLELPSLQTLVLSDTDESMPPYKVSDLLVTLPRFPSLHRLSCRFKLTHEEPNATFLIKLVQCLPNLTTLDVCIEEGGSNCTLSLLFALASTPTLGLRLRSLCLEDSRDCFLDVESVHRLVGALETRVAISKERVDGTVEVAQLTDVRMFCYYWRGESLQETQAEYLNGKLGQLEVGGTTCAIRLISLDLFLGSRPLGEINLNSRTDRIGVGSEVSKYYT